MSTDIPHPDRLGPGDSVGPWRILEVLGAGGLGRVFKVEQDGRLFALKMAVRLPGGRAPGEEDVDGWCMREATAMMGRSPHPNIPRIFQVGRWPDPEAGFLFVVMEYVDGLRFTDWRYQTHPSAAQLVDVMLPLVRTVADLHKAGIQHRDLNAQNVLVRKEDGTPVLLDFGSVALPGARTLTQGIPPMNLSVAPPEAFEHARLNGDDARFKGGPAADLYALGVLMYQALVDGYPFNPELPPERLLAAITLRMPRAPHWVNPKVPKSLSAITMRLLAKRPEERFESAETLSSALWEANKARSSREWKVPLDLPPSGPAPITDEELQERQLDEERAGRSAWAREQEEDTTRPREDAAEAPAEEKRSEPMSPGEPRRTKRVRHFLPGIATACALVVGLVALAWWWRYSPPNTAPANVTRPIPTMNAGPGEKVAPPWKSPDPEGAAIFPPTTTAIPTMPSEDSVSVKTPVNVQAKQSSTAIRAARRLAGAAITCSALTGCPGAQVRPAPPAEACPPGAVAAMEKLGIKVDMQDSHVATFDPTPKNARDIAVREGRASVFILGKWKGMPSGTKLSGRLVFGDRIFGRMTEAEVDGRTIPVCVELVDVEGGRGLLREPNGGPDSAKTFSSVRLEAVRRFE
jgi:serine/threonine-protein kinase